MFFLLYMIIHKSHSKLDLLEIINDLELKIVHSHQDNKKDIQEKLKIFCEKQDDFIFKTGNIYHIKNYYDLKFYLLNPNPKKKISIKEKKTVMFIAKNIINYCLHGKVLEWSPYYKEHQQIQDDLDYIKQFGDIPSVRRACHLMNMTLTPEEHYIPLISPQVHAKMIIKKSHKWEMKPQFNHHKGTYKLTFD